MSEPYAVGTNSIPALSAKLKKTPSDATVTFINVPKAEANKLKLNLTLSGFVKVEIREGNVVANTPKVSCTEYV